MANRMTPPAEGQEKDVLLVLDKQQGKVSAVKGIDKEGNLQTVPPTHGGEFMQVDKNSDVFSNFISNFYRKYQDTSGLELFSVKASEAERDAKAIEENHRNPTPEGDKRAEMLRVPKPDFHEFKQGYRFDPAKIDWENLKKVGITADTPQKHEGLRPGDAWLQVPKYLHRFGDGGRLLPQTYRCQALFLSGKGRHGSTQAARRAAGRETVATPVP